MFLEDFLGFIRAVEGLAVGIFTGPGVIAPDNEVAATVIFSNERVPDSFAWSTHTHGEGQQREFHGTRWIFRRQQLIAAHAGEVIHVARFGHTHHRMNQKTGFHLLRCAEGKLLMSSVHGIASLKGHDTPPAQARKFGAKFGGCQP